MNERKPIFYDEDRLRWRRTRRILEISGALFTLFLIVFFVTVVKRVSLPEIFFPTAHAGFRAATDQAKPKAVLRRHGRRSRVASLGQVPAGYDPLRAAFYVSWDTTSLASLQQHYRDIDLLIPEQLHSFSPDGRLDEQSDPKLAAWMQSLGIEIPTMPLLNNSDGTMWHIPEMAAMLREPTARRHLVQQAVARLQAAHQAGLALDFEQVPDKSQRDFTVFVSEAAAALHGANFKFMVALPADDDSYHYSEIAKAADAIIMMNYDEHWLYSPAGPIAPQDWFVENLQDMLKNVPPEKLVMGVANYAYDWPDKKGLAAGEKAESLEFRGIRGYRVGIGSAGGVRSRFAESALFLLRRTEPRPQRLDARWRYGLQRIARRRARGRARHGALALGYRGPFALVDLGRHSAGRRVARPLGGYAAGLRLDSRRRRRYLAHHRDAAEGPAHVPLRRRKQQDRGRKLHQHAAFLPDRTAGRVKEEIALSFDDGPDPRNTPQILDILKQKHAPATFFVIGSAANHSLGLLKREYDEGNEIGNHTYTHPEIDDVSRAQLELELNLTERLFASTLGVKTLLFRPPYGIDHQPETAERMSRSCRIPQTMGYLLVGRRSIRTIGESPEACRRRRRR